MTEDMRMVTAIAPVNIAVVKYWGKSNENLIIPLNDSLSGTLSTDQMCAKTTVALSVAFKKNRIWLNGKEESFENRRLLNCLEEVRKRAEEEGTMSEEELARNVHICSVNNFPTAAGLASSAAGYACLVYALCKLYGIHGDISGVARKGSGSACRSVYGGFVEWVKGELPDGTDSLARQIVDANHWPEMRVLILVVSDQKKKHSSTSGMQTTVATSDLLQHRIKESAPRRQSLMKTAILKKDFESFARLTMADSNQFHAVCLDTFPPLVYMTDLSHAIADLIHEINQDYKKTIVAYTFDAGPNACLYLREQHVPLVLAAINHVFPTNLSPEKYFTGLPAPLVGGLEALPSVSLLRPWGENALRYVIHTRIGDGPKELLTDHLIKPDGYPQ